MTSLDKRQKIRIRDGNVVRDCYVLYNSIQHEIEFTVGFFEADGSHHSRLVTRDQIVY